MNTLARYSKEILLQLRIPAQNSYKIWSFISPGGTRFDVLRWRGPKVSLEETSKSEQKVSQEEDVWTHWRLIKNENKVSHLYPKLALASLFALGLVGFANWKIQQENKEDQFLRKLHNEYDRGNKDGKEKMERYITRGLVSGDTLSEYSRLVQYIENKKQAEQQAESIKITEAQLKNQLQFLNK